MRVVPAGSIIRAYDSGSGRYVGFWICVEASELGVWEWRDA